MFAVGAILVLVASVPAARAGAIRPGFSDNVLPANDDGSTGYIQLPMSVWIEGAEFQGLYVNNNGNVTFDGPLSTYTPGSIINSGMRIIAPFWADVDTRAATSGTVTYGAGTVNGHPAFGVNWTNVGYYSEHIDKANSFQLVLYYAEAGCSGLVVEFNYDQVQWETGDASGGSGGLGGPAGAPAHVGYSDGRTFVSELPGSGVSGSFLDSNPTTGLVHNRTDPSDPLGRYKFIVEPTTAEISVSGLTATPGRGYISLSWTGVNVDSYTISRSTSSTGPYTVIASDYVGNSYVDSVLECNTTYYYVVRIDRRHPIDPVQCLTLIDSTEASARPNCNLLNINFTSSDNLKTGLAAVGYSANDVWNDYIFLGSDSAEMTDLALYDGSASGVTLDVWNAPGLWGNGVDDPMFNTYIYPWDGGDISLSVSALPPGSYDVYIYGHAPTPDGYSLFDLYTADADYGQRGTTAWGDGWNSTTWEEGQQYIVYRNVAVGDDGTFNVEVTPDAAGYSIINGMQIVPAGAFVKPTVVAADKLLNINFATTGWDKTGTAAFGHSSTDVWNNYKHPGQTYAQMTSLVWANGNNSGASITVQNAPGVWGNDLSDPMFHTYIYSYGGNITCTLNNIPSGNYDFYVYGHGPEDGNSVFQLSSGSNVYPIKGTSMWGTAWDSLDWCESQQYIAYRNVPVTAGQPVVLTVLAGISGYTIVNGVQIVRKP